MTVPPKAKTKARRTTKPRVAKAKEEDELLVVAGADITTSSKPAKPAKKKKRDAQPTDRKRKRGEKKTERENASPSSRAKTRPGASGPQRSEGRKSAHGKDRNKPNKPRGKSPRRAGSAASQVAATPPDSLPTHVVGIGASAGGLEALESFFDNMPSTTNLAFIVVQHLSPDFKSLMSEILARHTAMKICQTADGMPLERDTIYLAPARQNVQLNNGRIVLEDFPRRNSLNLPIDALFQSLARDQGERSVAVVLSGTGSDGTRGIRAVKEVGGMAMVQDETSARFDGMPRSAISTGLADFVLSPEKMPQQLLKFLRHPFARPDTEKPRVAESRTKLDQILAILRRKHHADFTPYKPSTLGRRIERRMGIHHVEEIEEYISRLDSSDAESSALVRDFLIGVTRFFRDEDAWNMLATRAVPRLVQDAVRGKRALRVWVPACSSGEEAYSHAIIFAEHLERTQQQIDLKVFATDIDQSAIDFAGRGVYSESIAPDLTQERLSRYFQRRGDTFEIRRSIRENVIFARHDLVRDPPFTRIDLVSCRNLLIYLQPGVQKRVISIFHYALNPHGCLLLGESETVGEPKEAFHPLSEKHRLYEKNPRASLPSPRQLEGLSGERFRQHLFGVDTGHGRGVPDSPVAKAHRFIAATYGPASILTDAEFRILHTFGDVSHVLCVPQGEFTADVTKLVPDRLRTPVSAALARAAKKGKPVVFTDVELVVEGNARKLTVEAHVLRGSEDEPPMYLVAFSDQSTPPTPEDAETFDLGSQRDERIRGLENELQQTRENLQATLEEMETSNEELQSTNEELLASNEELQSTNEELHSVNQELYTVNAEYQAKIHELTTLTNDFENLLRSTNIGTLFIEGRDLKIRKFTPAATSFVNLVEHDLGRPLSHLTHNLHDVDLARLSEQVIESGREYQGDAENQKDGTWVYIRIIPFVTEKGTTEGAVITFVDVTALKVQEEALRQSESRFRELAENVPGVCWLSDAHGKGISYVSPHYERIFGRQYSSLARIIDETAALVHPEDRERLVRRFRAAGAVGGVEEEFRILRPDGTVRWLRANTLPLTGASKEEGRFVGYVQDFTSVKEYASRLEQSNRELEQFASIISHDLQEPLRSIRGFLRLLERSCPSFGDPGSEYLENLKSGVARMELQVRDLLAFSRVTSAEIELRRTDTRQLVRNVVKDLSKMVEENEAEVTFDGLPKVQAAAGLLREVFQNLIENALKYRGSGPPRVEVAAAAKDEEWIFSVRDNGIGIRPDYHQRVFQMFKRLHREEAYPGSGVGLAIAKKIIERHAGRIWVESSEGVGSTFYFTLPRRSAP